MNMDNNYEQKNSAKSTVIFQITRSKF